MLYLCDLMQNSGIAELITRLNKEFTVLRNVL